MDVGSSNGLERQPTCHCVQVTSDATRPKRVHGELQLPMFFVWQGPKADLWPLPESLIFNYFYDIYRHIFVFPLETAG